MPLLRLPVRLLCLTSLLAALLSPGPARATPRLSCVEPVWCDIAAQLGGPDLLTHALITSEGLDPHTLQPSPLMARQLANSDAVLLNGATYDDWALKLLPPGMKTFLAASNAGWQDGADPHLFFDLPTVRRTARQVAGWLLATTPQARAAITARLARFNQQTDRLAARLEAIRQRDGGTPFAMTEPAGERLLLAAGLHLTDQSWARALMNESGLAPRDTAMLETAIQKREIRFLVHNPAISAPQARTVEGMARAAGIPLIAIGESLPAGLHWQDWLNHILDRMEDALKETGPRPAPVQVPARTQGQQPERKQEQARK